ncbi:peptidase [Bradyrhizobium sp. SSBR45G]|uniref:PepSY domain-containing protein n=1 Tax=unclassified Bradyrhizobium TaxID=2631580 RepID=UPI002342955A|nr:MULTISPECIES: PepSY domain-containing protein [unclassified Bradyrhizobium]GLH75368.1 peptidase [Bradyrhizobium sp. SSBR45G]GLH82845.1 peptidase [Bradyrhizobium sp. SSBR45R]
MRRRFVRTARRWLYLSHRWIGIATCLLFAMWFASGVVMMYVAFPNLSERERLAALPELDWSLVALSPDEALRSAGSTSYPRDLRLSMLGDAPVYRLTGWDGVRRTLSAVDGRTVEQISEQQALAVARSHPASRAPVVAGMVHRDQWSVTARYDPLRPFYLVGLGDAAGTELYVSARSGEILLDASRAERVWNWLGAIPHWIYPTVLRQDGALWRSVVLWISGICLIVGISGIWIGLLRVRLRRRYASGRITPYRGWMAWHHLTGLVAGSLVLTWMFSGWLSLNPGDAFANRGTARETLQRYAGHDAPDVAARLPAVLPRDAVEARFVWLQGVPLMIVASRDGLQTLRDPATGDVVRLTTERLQAVAATLMPGDRLATMQLYTQYDSYWYAHHQPRELPVLRAQFDDVAGTWFHISPVTGEVLGRIDDRRRIYRWLFNALHSFDFGLLLAYRPLWDVLVITLSLLGGIVSVSGVVIGWRLLRR